MTLPSEPKSAVTSMPQTKVILGLVWATHWVLVACNGTSDRSPGSTSGGTTVRANAGNGTTAPHFGGGQSEGGTNASGGFSGLGGTTTNWLSVGGSRVSQTNAQGSSSAFGGAPVGSGGTSSSRLTSNAGTPTNGGQALGGTSAAGAKSGGSQTTGGATAAGGKSSSGTASGGSNAGGRSTATSAAAMGGAASGGYANTGTGNRAGTGSTCSSSSYDDLILCEKPVGYWAMSKPSGTEPDRTANANAGTYTGTLTTTSLPNGDAAVVFNGSTQYLTIASRPAYSIPTTGSLTWEAWIQASVLQFPNDDGSGYVDWMGKCAEYSPTCEWEARMYSTTNSESRCNRISAYVFNPSAGLGSAADWQPTCGLIQASAWYHIVGEYTLLTQPANCANSSSYPGAIDIWVNGVQWNQSRHGQTGCMSQYSVVPKANTSPINIGTMAKDGWFPGAIAKVAIYDYLLTPTQIAAHYVTMTGTQPTGSCADSCSF